MIRRPPFPRIFGGRRTRLRPWTLLGFCLALTLAAAGANAPQAGNTPTGPNLIYSIQCFNNHRVPCSTILAHIYSRPGQTYDPAQINRDFNALWNTGFFDDITFKRVDTPKGVILQIWVTERPLIRTIKYKGLKSITESDILDRYKARNVHLEIDSQFDPTVAKHAIDAIKELLSEHGRQYATIKEQITPLPPSSVELTFVVDEGPKVQVGRIQFRGNHVLSAGTLRASMKNLHPIGIPYSLIFENLFSKTYDQAKLSEDLERVRETYQDRGYFEAVVEDPTLKLRTTHSTRILFWGGHEGKDVDITVPVVEGKKYKVGKVNFINNQAITNPRILENVFGVHGGDVMDVSKIRKGLENLRKAYGQLGYINFVANPDFKPNEEKQTIDLTMDMQEGKPFFIHRIEFTGNTTTRDKVIRRELLVQEGDRFNSQAWQNSLLRLNQLGYFDQIKPEDATIRQNTTGPEGEVDINLHLHEKGKNSIGLTGGVSGLFGSFLGLNYATNNFLGLGETLSFSTQYGSIQRAAQFGFTEPYLMDRPIELGFTLYGSSYHFDQAKQASIFYGANIEPYLQALAGPNQQGLLNYLQSSKGFTVSTSYPLPRSFTRVGLTYGYDISSLNPITTSAKLLFNSISFNNLSGPNSLTGIRTSRLIPSISYNTVNSVFFPTAGKEFEFSTQFAGIGGNVKLIEPTLSIRYFHKAFFNHVIGLRFLGSVVTGYGGGSPPSFDRFYSGGENTIRGFDLLAVTPIAMIPSINSVFLYDPTQPCTPTEAAAGGTVNNLGGCTPLSIKIPAPTPTNPSNTITKTFPLLVPSYQLTPIGGDTQAIGNFEYRIPIVGPVNLVYFADAGINRVSFFNQLRINPGVLNTLETDFQRPFNPRIPMAPGTNNQIRLSTGLELQVLMPVIHQPFRVYYAFNPLRVDETIIPPTPATASDLLRQIPSAFQNNPAVQQSLAFTLRQLQTGVPIPFREAPHVFRFTIGTTF